MSQKTTQVGAPVRPFTVLLSPTRRGARLARLLAAAQLREWGVPEDVVERAEHVVAELAANAAVHGRVPGRDFRLRLALTTAAGHGGVLRAEVADARHDRFPGNHPDGPPPGGESGRGLLLVEALADRWGVTPGPLPRKTVWAEFGLAAPPAGAR
ncbi:MULTISPECIES: ATP-binding protein [Streptomyces]|uniref:ATP-binding protein n=1 Tax=Streptomyces lycii TaxID=2654337 RepID=A0ABQ7FQ48_9ACTN|nr:MULTISPECIES: ATP-binding protein [Streptomyces]KAF4409402.1 ATP-binding protein [Streptomyces lycii]